MARSINLRCSPARACASGGAERGSLGALDSSDRLSSADSSPVAVSCLARLARFSRRASAALTVTRCSQVGRADSPRKVCNLRTTCSSTSWVHVLGVGVVGEHPPGNRVDARRVLAEDELGRQRRAVRGRVGHGNRVSHEDSRGVPPSTTIVPCPRRRPTPRSFSVPTRALLLDFDGTIADSFDAIAASANHTRPPLRPAGSLRPDGARSRRPRAGPIPARTDPRAPALGNGSCLPPTP